MSQYNETVATLVNMFNDVCQIQASDLGKHIKVDLTTNKCDDILDYCFKNLPNVKDFDENFVKDQLKTYVFMDKKNPLKREALLKKWMEIPVEISPVVIPISIFRHLLAIKDVDLKIKEMKNWKEFSNKYVPVIHNS